MKYYKKLKNGDYIEIFEMLKDFENTPDSVFHWCLLIPTIIAALFVVVAMFGAPPA
jgi:hypothetical protein